MIKKHIYTTLITFTVSLAFISNAKAQMTPMKAQYFQNPYLVNPAMAGLEGNTIFASYANQWNKLEGSPVMVALSASGRVTEKAAVGFNLISDKAGLLRRTQALGTFAYKVELDEVNSVRFGVSFSWAQDKLDQSLATNNGTGDPALAQYNAKQNYLDGNFGAAFVGKKFTAQFSILNLNQKRQSQISAVDYATFYSSLSYQVNLDQAMGVTLKPLVAYRGIKGFDNQFDIAAEWGIQTIRMLTMYHSSKSFSGGIGFKDLNKLSMYAIYSTEPQGLQGLSGGIYDITLGYKF